MGHDASPSAPAGRIGTAFLGLLAILAVMCAAFVVRKQLLMVLPMCTAGRWDLCFGTFNGVGLVSLAALPLAVLAVWVLAHRRSAAGTPLAWRRSLAEVGIVYGTLPWLWITMLPGAGAGVVTGRVSLVPLRDLGRRPLPRHGRRRDHRARRLPVGHGRIARGRPERAPQRYSVLKWW